MDIKKREAETVPEVQKVRLEPIGKIPRDWPKWRKDLVRNLRKIRTEEYRKSFDDL